MVLFVSFVYQHKKAVQLPLGEMSNHHRSPYLVGEFLQKNSLKFLRNSSCKSRFILYKGLWIFLYQSFLKKIYWIVKYLYCHRKATDNNSTLVLHNLDGFTKLFFDQFTLRHFQPLERFEKCTFYLLFLLVISIRTFRTERVVGIRNTKLRLSSLVL